MLGRIEILEDEVGGIDLLGFLGADTDTDACIVFTDMLADRFYTLLPAELPPTRRRIWPKLTSSSSWTTIVCKLESL